MENVCYILSAALIAIGMFFFFSAALGVNRFRHALNRIHAAALGDTLGLLFLAAGLIVRRGFCFTSAKLLVVVFFFWVASPVASHMIGQLEIETDNDLGELKDLDLTNTDKDAKVPEPADLEAADVPDLLSNRIDRKKEEKK